MSFPCFKILLMGCALLGAGCATGELARIPSGPRMLVPRGLSSRLQGPVLRLERNGQNMERCAIEIETRTEKKPSQALAARFRKEGVTQCTEAECLTEDSQTLPITSVQKDIKRMPAPPGNTLHVVLARTFGEQTILLTYCPDDHKLSEQELTKLLLYNLRP